MSTDDLFVAQGGERVTLVGGIVVIEDRSAFLDAGARNASSLQRFSQKFILLFNNAMYISSTK